MNEKLRETLEEKVDKVIEWKKAYPDLKTSYSGDSYINDYFKAHEEIDSNQREEILEKYREIQNDLKYIKLRKNQGKISEEDLEKLRQADVDTNVFGYSDRLQKVMMQYRISDYHASFILNKYGSTEAFAEEYKAGKLDNESIETLGYILNNCVNIDGENEKENRLILAIIAQNKFDTIKATNIVYSGKKLREHIEKLSYREQKVLLDRFDNNKDLETIAADMDVTRGRVRIIEAKAIRHLRHHIDEFTYKNIDEETENKILSSNVIFRPFYKGLPCDLDFRSVRTTILAQAEEERKLREANKPTTDDQSSFFEGLSVRAYNCLKRAGINNLSDIQKLSQEELSQVRNLGRKCTIEVIKRMEELGLQMKDETPESKQELIEKIKGEMRTSNILDAKIREAKTKSKDVK